MDFLGKIREIGDPQGQLDFAREYVRTIYPDLADAELTIPEQGEQKFVFVTGDEVIYVARNAEISNLMHDEAAVLESLEGKTSFDIPSVIDFEPDNHIMRVKKLKGSPLTPARLAAMPAEKRNDLARRIGIFMAEMHESLPQGAKIEPPWWREQALGNISELLAQGPGDYDHRRLVTAQAYINGIENISDDIVTLHSDLHDENIFYDAETDTLGAIDFTGVKAGHRHREFVKPHRAFTTDFVERMIKSYEEHSGVTINRPLIAQASDTFDMVMWDGPGKPAFLDQHPS